MWTQVNVHVFADVISLSSGGSVLRAWNLPDGQMVWESTVLGSNASKPLLLIPVSLRMHNLMLEDLYLDMNMHFSFYDSWCAILHIKIIIRNIKRENINL